MLNSLGSMADRCLYQVSNSGGNFEFWVTVGFASGIYSFFKGFRVYRQYRVLEDTPEIPIRSIPMGWCIFTVKRQAKTW